MCVDRDDNGPEGNRRLERIAAGLKSDEKVEPITVRELLRWFGAERREDQVNNMIRNALRKNNLRTDPDFAEQFIDGAIEFREGYRLNENEARWLSHFHATLIKARVEAWIDQHPGEPTQSEVTEKFNALSQQLKIEDFTEEEVEAAHVALFVEDLIRNGEEPDVASDLAEKMRRYPRNDDIAGWVAYLIKREMAAPVSRKGRKVIFGPWKNRDTETNRVTTFRIRGLEAANKPVVAIKPDDSITEAISLMRLRDFSPVPVMTTETVVKGVVTWKSIVSHQLLSAADGWDTNLRGQAQEYMETPWSEVRADSPLLETIDAIVRHQYVIVCERNNKISGIVTNNDLSMELQQRSEPFLLINRGSSRCPRLVNI